MEVELMRPITFNLPEEIVIQLQQLPNADQFVSDVLNRALCKKTEKICQKKTLPVFHGDGLQPGIDLNHSKQLQDKMDEDGIT